MKMEEVTLAVEKVRRLPTALLSRKATAEQRANLEFTVETKAGHRCLIGVDTRRAEMPIEGTFISQQPVKYAIGYREAGSNTMRVFECDVFSVDMNVKRTAPEADEKMQAGNYLEQRTALIESYAPAKKRRQVKLAVNAQVKDDKILDSEKSIKDLKEQMATQVANAPLSGVLAQMHELLPPFDTEATDPARIFDFSTIFTDEVISSLNPSDESSICAGILQWMKSGCQAVPPSHELYPILSLRTIIKLGQIFLSSEHMKRKSFARLVVICAGLLLSFIHRAESKRSAETVCVTQEVKHVFDSAYGWGRLNQEGADRLLCHLILFIIRLTPDSSFTFGLLTEDIKGLNPRDLSPILEFCGLKISSGLTGKLAAPLKPAALRKKVSK